MATHASARAKPSARASKKDGRRRGDHHVHAREERLATFAICKRVASTVACDKARRAGGVVRHTGADYAEYKREPARGEAVPATREAVHAEALRLCDWCVLRVGDADEDSEWRAQQTCAQLSCRMQRNVAVLKEQALLWVHHGGLGGRDTKMIVVEEIGARHEAAVTGSLLDCLRQTARQDPPCFWHRAKRVHAGLNEAARSCGAFRAAGPPRAATTEAHSPAGWTERHGSTRRWLARLTGRSRE
eukprot:scaffold315452_cov27-Tisochrysis_lutea.AAC.7